MGPTGKECSPTVAELIKQPATVVEGYKIKISLGDLLRLELNEMLNDNILNFYMQVDCVNCVFVNVLDNQLCADDRGKITTGCFKNCPRI